jgi:hypothetical protein
MADKIEIVIRNESALSLWVRMVATLSGMLGVAAFGIYANSQALQWVGLLLFIVLLAIVVHMKNKPVSIAEARRRLDEIERQQ